MALMQKIIDCNLQDDTEILRLLKGKSPMSIREEARTMLETVMRLYYARHDFEIYDPWITFALAAIGNMTIAHLAGGFSTDPRLVAEYHSTLILSAQGLNKQGLNNSVSMLVAIQLEKAMTPKDLQLVQTHTTTARIEKDDEILIAQQSDSLWPVAGITGLHEDPDKARLGALVKTLKDAQL